MLHVKGGSMADILAADLKRLRVLKRIVVVMMEDRSLITCSAISHVSG